jgi:hypothetical protein
MNEKQVMRELSEAREDLTYLKNKKGLSCPCSHEWHRLRRAIKVKLETIQRLENKLKGGNGE